MTESHDRTRDMAAKGARTCSEGRERTIAYLRVGGDDEDVVVGGEVCFEPDDGAEIEMVGRLVEEEEMGLDEQSTRERDTHPPTTRHVLRRLRHHLLREAETVEDRTGLRLRGGSVHDTRGKHAKHAPRTCSDPSPRAPRTGGRARSRRSGRHRQPWRPLRCAARGERPLPWHWRQ